MRKLIQVLGLVMLIVGLGAGTGTVTAQQTHIVCPEVGECDFTTIQAAVDEADSGDTIEVQAGTYSEDILVSTPNLRIVGESLHEAEIQGTVTVQADTVTLEGFHITNFSQTPTPDWSGVYIPAGTGVVISNNFIDGEGLDPTESLTVGVHTLFNAEAGILVQGNTIQNVRLGVYNQGSVMEILDNHISSTSHTAIGVDTDMGTSIKRNHILNNANFGLELFRTNVEVQFNTIAGNGIGLSNQSGGPIDARFNWWGHNTGPVVQGLGDSVEGEVSFEPWLSKDHETVLQQNIGFLGFSYQLPVGWSTFSVPIAVENSQVFAQEGEFGWTGLIEDHGEGVIAYKFVPESEEGPWEQVVFGTMLHPMEAVYIRSEVAHPAILNASSNQHISSRVLEPGWNLVGTTAQLGHSPLVEEQSAPGLELALLSLSGFTQVHNPPINQHQFDWIIGSLGSFEEVMVGEGFWVFRQESAVLPGIGSTPLSLP